MQMRKMYESTDKRQRALDRRIAGHQCADAGFREIAAVNFGEAALLDPGRDPVTGEFLDRDLR